MVKIYKLILFTKNVPRGTFFLECLLYQLKMIQTRILILWNNGFFKINLKYLRCDNKELNGNLK